MKRTLVPLLLLVCVLPLTSSGGAGPGPAPAPKALPPGWLPVHRLDAKTPWAEVRKVEDKVFLYLPEGVDNLRGVFPCVVFHSGDPREVARAWKFALVTIPWKMLWDVGLPDKRSPRGKQTGLPMGDMGVLLRYLEVAAKETKHPELAVSPIAGWLMQNGELHAADLFRRAPDRVVAWVDSFPNRITRAPELTAKVPFAFAWELTDAKQRREERAARLADVRRKPTPPADLKCRATTYGFKHGIYSKWNFFMLFLTRCLLLRMPADPPPPGQPTPLQPVIREKGWAGDYNEIGEWNAIASVAEARGMVMPVWLPDAYTAWAWRAYHSANPGLKIVAPAREYKKGGGKDCGLGYGAPLRAGVPLRFAAEAKADYAKVEFHDGDRIRGVAEKAPWQVEGVRLEPGLRALFAVGVRADGSRQASRPAFVVVEERKQSEAPSPTK